MLGTKPSELLRQVEASAPKPSEHVGPITGETVPPPTLPAVDVTGWSWEDVEDMLALDDFDRDEWEATTAPTEHLSDRSWDARHVQAATKASTTCPNERANASRS